MGTVLGSSATRQPSTRSRVGTHAHDHDHSTADPYSASPSSSSSSPPKSEATASPRARCRTPVTCMKVKGEITQHPRSDGHRVPQWNVHEQQYSASPHTSPYLSRDRPRTSTELFKLTLTASHSHVRLDRLASEIPRLGLRLATSSSQSEAQTRSPTVYSASVSDPHDRREVERAIVLYLELGLVLGCRSPCDAGIRSELRVRVRVTRDDESEHTVAPGAKLGSGMGDFKMQASGVRVLASKMTSPQARGRQTQPRALGSSLALLANSHLCCNTRTVGLSFDSSTFDPFAGPLCAAESVRPSVRRARPHPPSIIHHV